MDYLVTVAPKAGEAPDPNLVVVDVGALDEGSRPNIAAAGRAPVSAIARIIMRPVQE